MLMLHQDDFIFYIFGSFLNNKKPNDIDILVVYDPKKISPKNVYIEFNALFGNFENEMKLPIDVLYLTYSEALSSKFVIKEKAELLSSFPEMYSKIKDDINTIRHRL